MQRTTAMRQLCSITALTSRELMVILVSSLVALGSSAALACCFAPHVYAPTDGLQLRGPFRHLNNSYSYAAIFNRPDYVPDSQSHQSSLLLYKDDKLIGPPHATLDDITHQGRGRYSYAADRQFSLIFSTSDNSDPNANGRTYRVVDRNARDPYEKNLRR